jgi:hypothetical protein
MCESIKKRSQVLKVVSALYLGFARKRAIDTFSFALSPLYGGQQVARELRVDRTGCICWNFSRGFLGSLRELNAK